MAEERRDEGQGEQQQAEQEEADEVKSLEPHIVHAAIRAEGEFELGRPVGALAWSALAAGLSMGFSMVAEGLLQRALPDAPWRPLVANFGYCVGFLIVVLGRQQLFTENTLTVMLPLMSEPSTETLGKVLRLWGVVLLANVVGVACFAFLCARTGIFEPSLRHTFAQLGMDTYAPGFGLTFLRGIFGGWLIALMVWMLPSADKNRVAVIILVTFVVGLGRFSHCVAGSVEALYAVFAGQATLGQYLGQFLVPAVLGNTLGGVALVAGLNHAQAQHGQAS